MSFNKTITYKMIKSEDLNHHGTLFAGRCSEWFVEASFIAAGSALDPKRIVCLKVHGLEFTHPMKIGNILGFESRIVHTGRTTLTVQTIVHEIKSMDITRLEGYVTFCHLDENSKPTPHGIEAIPNTEEEKIVYKKAEELLQRRN